MTFYVYILRCADNSLYVGHCTDLEERLREHNSGEGAKHTRERRPVVLVYQESFPTQVVAIRRERQLKRWSHQKKDALVRGDKTELKRLAKRRS